MSDDTPDIDDRPDTAATSHYVTMPKRHEE